MFDTTISVWLAATWKYYHYSRPGCRVYLFVEMSLAPNVAAGHVGERRDTGDFFLFQEDLLLFFSRFMGAIFFSFL